MRTINSRQARRRVGSVCISTGVLLLLAFLAISGWNHLRGQRGIEVFEAARAAAPEPAGAGSRQVAATDIDLVLDSPQPDYRLWSEKRIADYRASLLASQERPKALLNIERLGIRVPVYNGANELNLNRGVARIIGTGRIGGDGNLGIAGHRDGFFRSLKDIQMGDRISVESLQGTTEFVVTSIRIIDPTELEVLAPTDSPAVTLVTCYPFYFVGNAPQRFIVRGEVSSRKVFSQRSNT